MLSLSLLIQLPSSAKGQGKHPGVVSAAMRYRVDGISLTCPEAEKMSNITHPALWQQLHGAQGIQGTHSLRDWIRLGSIRRTSPGTWGPGNVQILRELGMTQAIYAPFTEGLIHCRNKSENSPGNILVWDGDIHTESSCGTRFL